VNLIRKAVGVTYAPLLVGAMTTAAVSASIRVFQTVSQSKIVLGILKYKQRRDLLRMYVILV
jgi:hypothetical protein